MKGITVEKLVPLLTSPVWYKRLVGEYYEVLIRRESARNWIESLRCRLHALPPTDIAGVTRLQTEIEMMREHYNVLTQYEDVLYRRLFQHTIPFIDILSEVLDASDVLTDLPEPPKEDET